jgi:transposase-like protein
MSRAKTTKRQDPKRANSSECRYSIMEFDREFPDDSACMDFLVGKLYPDGIYCPNCGRITSHYRVRARTCYECQFCGHQEYPLVGTIFERSSTSLRLWFQAMYLMASTRCGISAKQLEREIGVSYPTAWRMFKVIRSLLDQNGDGPLSGHVEVDETWVGGMPRAGQIKNKTERGKWMTERKTPVVGAVERGGRVRATVTASTRKETIVPFVRGRVLPESTVYTDEWHAYKSLGHHGYTHRRIKHSEKVYVSGDVHTQTIEGFWALLKGGLTGVYHGVSTKHLQAHVDEYVFRYNNRAITGRRGLFDAFLSRIEKVQVG